MYWLQPNITKIKKKHFYATMFLLTSCFFSSNIIANQGEPPKIGNFALPSSQQQGPLVSFGQNILDTKVTQFYFVADKIGGYQQHFVDVAPSIAYGITDRFSFFFNAPLAVSYSQNETHSNGLEDMSLQFEYAYHMSNSVHFTEQATVVSNITFPTGSSEKQPTTGLGSPSFLIGTTYSRTNSNWYGFVSPGIILNTSDNKTKFGNKVLYQFGLGRNIMAKPDAWIVSWLIEIDGIYAQKDKIQGNVNDSSGGNIINVIPSLWLSTNKLIFQIGLGAPVVQHLFGIQNHNHYLLISSVGWTL